MFPARGNVINQPGRRTNLDMKTFIVGERPKLRNAVLIEGLPGLGLVGKIAVTYLIERLGAEKVAELYSPHFPHYAETDEEGRLRLLRNEFYLWRGPSRDVLLLTGDCQAQTTEGQYEIAEEVAKYARQVGVELIVTVGGFSKAVRGVPGVVASSTDGELLDRLRGLGVEVSPPGNPIVGMAGVLVAVAGMMSIRAVCLLGETRGYLPDVKAAREVLKVLVELLKLDVDLEGMEEEVRRSERIAEEFKRIEKRAVVEERITYIS